ncbi:DNA cytosine methyltransferase [Ralstonia flatus]|uniref:DNA cytosine methyltransferase n=1 Tax=Ralstonia flatus TaxID=3058601 RepID=UPI0019D1D6ED|nr:DNA cytosine methyltransferase [Ralstonia sp. LMG 32965]MBN6211447.1 DNA cytosine methyltransferase [Ralstonia pickettii]
MAAYYNEFDPYVAQWLRNLIAAGHIAPGDVDERDIQDVRPDDLRGYTQCHFFAGIGVWSLALRRAGWPDDRSVWTGSCPCQPFSAAGKGLAFDDERHLWPAFHWLIKQRRPPTVLGEQVASKDADPWIDLVQADMEAVDYGFGAVPFPSASIGAPHIRDRIYWVAHAGGIGRQRWTYPLQSVRKGAPEWGEGFADAERSGLLIGLADSNDSQSQGRRGVPQRTSECVAGSGGLASRLAHADGSQPGIAGRSFSTGAPGIQSGAYFDGCGTPRGVGDTDGELQRGNRRGKRSATSSPQGEMGGQDGQRHGFVDVRASSPACAAGPVNGFWGDADWLLCRDGKWRPVEPGTFPLAHGAPSRVGRLRAYGNAINAIQAQIWCETVMEALS